MYKTMTCGIVALFLMALYGCGSGDNPSLSPTTQTPIDPHLTVPVQTAFANFVNNGVDAPFTISGSKNESTQNNPIPPTALTGNGRLTIGPGDPGILVADRLTVPPSTAPLRS